MSHRASRCILPAPAVAFVSSLVSAMAALGPPSRVLSSVLVAVLTAGAAIAQQKHPFNERPADVAVTMSSATGTYNGNFTLSGEARTCGEVPADLNFAGVNAFGVIFYDETGKYTVQNVTFDSKELVGGKTVSTTFHLNLSIKAKGVTPLVYVLNPPTRKMTGTAILTYPTKGTLELRIKGVNDRSETVDLTLVCRPRVAPRTEH